MNARTSQPALPWIWLIAFAAVVAFLGGSSRMDAVQLAALRPLTALFLIPAFYMMRIAYLRGARMLLALLVAISAWTIIQLIPLPPSIWHGLSGREPIVAMDAALGLQDLWRPIALAPARGWNAVAALLLPLAALLLALSVKADTRMLLFLVAGLGVLDAALGLLQVMNIAGGVLYFYEVTNAGAPVGIFANENHSAVFSACTMLVLTRLGLDGLRRGDRGAVTVAYIGAFLLVLLAGLVSGSRGGFLTAFVSLVACGLMFATSTARSSKGRRRKSRSEAVASPQLPSKWFFAAAVVALLSLPALFIALDQAPALSNIIAEDNLQDLRWAVWPTLQEMMAVYWLWGSGFGSFEQAYHIYEETALLRPSYLNQAHNDLAQLVIEGGLIAVVIFVALLAWIASSVWSLRAKSVDVLAHQIFWLAVFSIIAFASALDYPLRAPAFQLVGVWLLVALARDGNEGFRDGRGSHRKSERAKAP